VQFRAPDPAVPQPDARNALHLPPTALSLQATKPGQITNALANRNGLDIGHFTQNLKVRHAGF
jgi:hypothetical protein